MTADMMCMVYIVEIFHDKKRENFYLINLFLCVTNKLKQERGGFRGATNNAPPCLTRGT